MDCRGGKESGSVAKAARKQLEIKQGCSVMTKDKASDYLLRENDDGKSQKQPNLSISEEKQSQKQPNLSVSEFPTMLTWNVYHAIKLNRKAKYSWLADNLGVSERTI